MVTKEAPTTPRVKHLNETLSDRSVPFFLMPLDVYGAPPNSSFDSDLQESELVPRLSCIQSHRREDATLARP